MGNIDSFFNPSSVAVIGATEREGTVGQIVLSNLMLAQDRRKVYPVNPNREKIYDLKCYTNVSAIPQAPELAVIALPAKMVPDVVEECGKVGIGAIIIISAGFKEIGAEGKALEDRIFETALKYGIRIIGPNCLGVIKPSTKLNATFAKQLTRPGNVAFLSQSGALGSAVLDWAISRDVGFSAFVSLGSMLDVDFGALIDYFGEDPDTKSIMIYMESLGNSRENVKRFMSAARGFARNKPVIIIKPGKFQESRQAAKSHTGAMVGEDLYYDAAFKRAGTIRVEQIEDLFNCAAILNTSTLPTDPNLAIITNAGGPAVLATDALISMGGKLAKISKETITALNSFLPAFWSKANPVDILGDADQERFVKTIEVVLKDPGVSGAVIMYTPQATADPVKIAKAIVKYARKSRKPILTSMMGSADVEKARQVFYENKVPTYDFPEEAIKTYLFMYQYSRNMDMLYETPEDSPLYIGAPKNYLKILARNVVKDGRTLLSEEDSKKFLSTYGINTTIPYIATTVEEATLIAAGCGYPVVMKIHSPDITHKSDVGGVSLNINSDAALKKAFEKMMADVKKAVPTAKIEGVSIQKMVKDYDYELIVGGKKDSMLGPVVMFGMGGTEAEYYKDVSVGLAPLNQILTVRRLQKQTGSEPEIT